VTITNGYATLPQFKAWISDKETVIDAILEKRIETSSRWIDHRCEQPCGRRRHFYQVTEARVFDTTDPNVLRIDDLLSVTTLKTDENADGTFETTWAASDYQLLPFDAPTKGEPYTEISALLRRFPLCAKGQRVGRIQVTGLWGWTAIPNEVHTACLLHASRGLKRRHSPEGVIGVGEFGGIRVSNRQDPDVDSYLHDFMTADV
jgi:hypothetical protein